MICSCHEIRGTTQHIKGRGSKTIAIYWRDREIDRENGKKGRDGCRLDVNPPIATSESKVRDTIKAIRSERIESR